MPISQDEDTGKWRIGEGQPRYKSEEAARSAYDSYLKRGGKPVEKQK